MIDLILALFEAGVFCYSTALDLARSLDEAAQAAGYHQKFKVADIVLRSFGAVTHNGLKAFGANFSPYLLYLSQMSESCVRMILFRRSNFMLQTLCH